MEENRDRKTARERFRHSLGIIYRLLAIVFILLTVAAVAANIFHKDKEYSSEENRQLAQMPAISWEAVKNGKFMSDFEDYISDQFFMRNQWISLKLTEDRLLGKKESNGVYLGKKGYLMEVLREPDWENTEKNAKSIAEFASRHSDIPVYMGIVPNAAYILKDKVPTNAPVRDQQADIQKVYKLCGSQVNDIDLVRTMQDHADEAVYYKTDHHWTSLGAYYGFMQIARKMNIADPETEYNIYTVADDFQGTLASKSGYHGSRDKIEIYEAKNKNPEYVVSYTEEGEKSASVYDSEKLKEKDKYTVFMGGNHARVDISTTVKDGGHLLLFKDSYANCMVQFLLPYYQDIIMIDPRYFYNDIDKIIEDYGITDVLFLYNASTFLADNSIADVLAESEAENGQEESQGTQEDSQENTQGAQEDGQENTQATQGESQDNTQGTQENGQENAQGDQGETQDDTQSE